MQRTQIRKTPRPQRRHAEQTPVAFPVASAATDISDVTAVLSHIDQILEAA